MFQLDESFTALDKPSFYKELHTQTEHLLDGERDMIANLANVASLLYHSFAQVNWSGFYLWKESANELVLGPFHGKPACVRIASGRGVCGAAVERRATVLVEDVEAFPGHIACDAASRSEIVIPLLHNGALLGVLDIDSPVYSRFDDDDKQGLERLVEIVVASFA
ncbi:MAG: GAF domain-containing protein [Candidatus Kapaibacterium sp.]|nr:MAG: GAF domain-containing protein [Candidatus Kapabacteria bacterium]